MTSPKKKAPHSSAPNVGSKKRVARAITPPSWREPMAPGQKGDYTPKVKAQKLNRSKVR